MKLHKLFLSFLLLLLSPTIYFGQAEDIDAVKYFDENKRWYNTFTEHWFMFFDIPEAEIRDSIIQFDKISKDLKTSKNEWEGTYGNGGDTHGSYLHWSKNSGFVWLVVNKCNGGPMKITRGKVLVTDSAVKFIPEKVLTSSFQHGGHSHQKSDEYKTREFLFVEWRKANFVIESNELTNFADFTAGLNPETSGLNDEGWYFSKVSQSYVGSANELPIFPAGYEKYVRKPFKATIISVGRSFRRAKSDAPADSDETQKSYMLNYDDLVTEVKLDIGKSSNISPGMFLRFVPETYEYRTNGMKITKVFDNHSIAEYVTDAPKKTCKKSDSENCEAEERRTLKAGLRLSTTAEW